MGKMGMASSAQKHYQARIFERRDLSPDLWIMRIDPGGPFEFRAGQYATLGVEHEGKRVEDLLRKYADQWGLRAEETTGYLCGHPAMVENARGILYRAGWKKDAVFEEAYFQPAKGEAAGTG